LAKKVTTMTVPESGDIVIYPYLWLREAAAGETEGRKSRPSCVAVSLEKSDHHVLFLLPITTQAPTKGTHAIEIPQLEKQRIGLDIGVRSWVVVDEYNLDIAENSYYLEPQEPIGRVSRQFLVAISRAFYSALQDEPGREVDRTGYDDRGS